MKCKDRGEGGGKKCYLYIGFDFIPKVAAIPNEEWAGLDNDLAKKASFSITGLK